MKNRPPSNRPRGRLSAALFAILALVLSPVLANGAGAQELAARPAPWIVVEAEAPAMVRYDRGPWQPLAAGAVVAAAGELRTGRDGRLLLARGEDRVQLLPESYLELPPFAEDGVMTRFIQWLGQVLFEVGPRPSPHFSVETPYLVATVKGTAFAVEVTREGAAVAVTSGIVAVATPGGAASDIVAGRTARAFAGLSGLFIEDSPRAGGAPARAAPDAESDHTWPSPSFDPIGKTLPRW
jgi:hypothetical protein